MIAFSANGTHFYPYDDVILFKKHVVLRTTITMKNKVRERENTKFTWFGNVYINWKEAAVVISISYFKF